MRRSLLLALAALLLLAAPAGAVIGGAPVAPAQVPWFAELSRCGGMLVAPDRILTAGHCVEGVSPSELERIEVAGAVFRGTRVALHPDWRRRNGPISMLDDVAVVQLDRPAAATPARLAAPGERVPRRLTLLGTGVTRPQRRVEVGALRAATLATVADAPCGRRWRGRRGNAGARWEASRMLCAVDVDGRAPLSSACNGDSGGAMFAGSRRAPVLFGVTSWVGPGCGTDGLPTVGAEVARYRGFALAPAPVWAPVSTAAPRITGDPRPGATLTCETSWDGPLTHERFRWRRSIGGGRLRSVGTALTYTVRPADAGRLLGCRSRGENAGGWAVSEPGETSAVRIAG